jgi:hypothetical protein
MKADDYMNDPRMADLANEPLPVREVHAWRLMVQDEKKGMNKEQREAYYRKSREQTDAECARSGFKLQYVETVS